VCSRLPEGAVSDKRCHGAAAARLRPKKEGSERRASSPRLKLGAQIGPLAARRPHHQPAGPGRDLVPGPPAGNQRQPQGPTPGQGARKRPSAREPGTAQSTAQLGTHTPATCRRTGGQGEQGHKRQRWPNAPPEDDAGPRTYAQGACCWRATSPSNLQPSPIAPTGCAQLHHRQWGSRQPLVIHRLEDPTLSPAAHRRAGRRGDHLDHPVRTCGSPYLQDRQSCGRAVPSGPVAIHGVLGASSPTTTHPLECDRWQGPRRARGWGSRWPPADQFRPTHNRVAWARFH